MSGRETGAELPWWRGRPLRWGGPLPPILMYHHVVPVIDDPVPPIHRNSYLTVAEFRGQLDWLVREEYETLTLAEAVERATGGERLPRKSVVLTFDDGAVDFEQHAWPELEQRGMTATLYVVSGRIGDVNRWDMEPGDGSEPEREERLLDAASLRRLAAQGVEIGGHSATHPDLTKVDDGRLADEIDGCRRRLRGTLGIEAETYCYPYGRHNEQVEAAVRDAGFLAAVAIETSPASARHLNRLRRWPVRSSDNPRRFWLKASGWYHFSRQVPPGLLSGRAERSGEPNRAVTDRQSAPPASSPAAGADPETAP